MQKKVLITGATGVLGREMVKQAGEAGFAVRQGVRTPAKASASAEAVRLDYAEPLTIGPAFEGVSALVLMAPPLEAKAPELLGPVLAAAKVEQIVLISAFGVNHNEQAPMRIVEHLVIGSGVPYTILRPNFFMENFSEGFLAENIRQQNGIFLAAGDGKTSFISVQDIAAVAVTALQRGVTGAEIDLTGPQALDHAEVAKILSEAAGREIVYHSLCEEEMVAGARAHGMPEPIVAYMAMLYAIVRAGHAAGIVPFPDFAGGRQPLTFESFAAQAGTKEAR